MSKFDQIYDAELERWFSRPQKQVDEESKKPVIDDQTIMFWTLQLQFMAMDFATLIGMIDNLMIAGLYVKNKKSKKIQRYVNDLRNWGIIPDPNKKACVATHLALQLSGLA